MVKFCYIYLKDSDNADNLIIQNSLIQNISKKGYLVKTIFKEKKPKYLKKFNRPEFDKLLRTLQKNDVVFFEKLNDIIITPFEKVNELIDLIKNQNINVFIYNIPFLSDNTNPIKINPTHKIETLNEFLINLIYFESKNYLINEKTRQLEGIEIAQKKKKSTGRPPNLKLHKKIIKYRNLGLTIKEISTKCGCSDYTVKKVIKSKLGNYNN